MTPQETPLPSPAARSHLPPKAAARGSRGHLLVWLGNNVHADALVRQAQQLAQAAAMSWTAMSVDTPVEAHDVADPPAHALQALQLAERLGAAVLSLDAVDVLKTVVAQVEREDATVLVIGDHGPKGWLQGLRRHWLGGLADALAARLPGVTLHVVHFPATTDADAPAPRRRAVASGLRSGALGATVVVGLCTAITEVLLPIMDRSSVVTVYFAGVVYVALRMGQTAATLAVLLSILAFDLLTVEPRWSFRPLDTQYYLTFLVMGAVGVLISRLVARASLQAELADARARRAQALSELAGHLVSAHTDAHIAAGLAQAVRTTFGVSCALLLPDGQGRLQDPQQFCAQPDSDAVSALAPAQALFDGVRNDSADAPDSGAQLLVLLQGKRGTLGVLAVRPLAGGIGTPEDRQLLDAMANQAALALERALFEQRSASAALEAETERLRNTLLSGISHDFRTPLTTIIGAASSLLEQDQALDAGRRRLLLEGLLEEARRVHGSMSDLLDLTRIEEGQLRPLCEWCPVDDLVQEIRDALGPRTALHVFEAEAPADAIVWCDPRLIVQAAVNLVDNALRHTPAGGHITLRLTLQSLSWTLGVADDGPGLPPGQEHEVFKKFARARGDGSDGGTGLGLAICAAVARLHQGRIEARNAGGAVFTMTLPQPAPPGSLDAEVD